MDSSTDTDQKPVQSGDTVAFHVIPPHTVTCKQSSAKLLSSCLQPLEGAFLFLHVVTGSPQRQSLCPVAMETSGLAPPPSLWWKVSVSLLVSPSSSVIQSWPASPASPTPPPVLALSVIPLHWLGFGSESRPPVITGENMMLGGNWGRSLFLA